MLTVLIFASLLNAPDLSPVAMERLCDEPAITLVTNGCARLPVITAEGPRERAAAFYLVRTIREITGVKPTLYLETATHPVTITPALRIASADNTDTFRVITKDGSIHFLGRSDFAVYDWCERVLGVRHYPTDAHIDGKCVWPSPDNLVVPSVDYADQSVFTHRDNWPFGRETWARVGKMGGSHRGGVAVHAPHRWFADPDVRTNHPNIFARQRDGSRGEMPLLCYGNPETLAYYQERIDQHIAGIRDSGGIVDTNRHVITVSHWDTLLECSCAHCQRLFDPTLGMSGSGSPIIWGYFLKNLAQWACATHPDYTIAFLPYLNVCDVPAGLDLKEEGNCEAMVCSMPGLALFKEPALRAHEETLIKNWAYVTGRKVINWHYGCWPREFTSAPYLFGKTIAAHYQRMAPYEVGSFINGGNSSASEQLSNYVWIRCLWNPSIDVDALYDAFARRMFGAGAPAMRRVMSLQEEGWTKHWTTSGCRMENVFDISYPPDTISEMKRLLIEAAERTRDDPRATARIRWYAADFARFFADEKRYREGKGFEPLRIGASKQDARVRTLVPAFDPAKRLVRTTSVRAFRTDAGLSFTIRCAEPAMTNLTRTAAYGELRKQDTLELFFDPSGTTTGVCHRIMLDVRNRLTTTADVPWLGEGIRSVVRCEADAWYVDLFIPFSTLRGPVSRERWHGNIIRWHPGTDMERERSRLSTLGSKWNQSKDAFSEWLWN